MSTPNLPKPLPAEPFAYFEQQAFRVNSAPQFAEPWQAWFNTVTDTFIELAESARSFRQEVLLFQFATSLSTVIECPSPEPLEFQSYELPTPDAYLARRRQLVAAGRYQIPTPDPVDAKEYPTLPEDELIPALPSFDELSDEHQSELKSLLTNWFDAWKSSALVQSVQHQLKKSRVLLKELASNESWQLVREEPDLKTYYRPEAGLPNHSFKVVGILENDVISLFQLMYEVTLFDRWFPLMRKCEEKHVYTRYAKICQATIAAMWPWADRELLLDCSGVDDTARGRVLINIHDLSEESDHWEQCNSSLVRCYMHTGGFMLVPLTPTKTEISFFININPQLTLPTSLLNLVTGKLIHALIPTMAKYAPKTQGKDSPWYNTIQQHESIYREVGDIVNSFFLREEEQQQEQAKDGEETKPE